MQQAGKSGFLDNMSPMQVFVFGIVEGILVLCTIGFFVLLSGNGGFSFGGDSGRVVKNNPTPPVVQQGGGEPAAPGSITAVDKDNDHIRGNVNAKYSIVEYSDLECPFCSRFHDTMVSINQQYGEDVNWVYRHFPLESIHAEARPAAIASECAAEQGKFWEFTDAVFEAQAGGQRLNTEMYTDIFSSFAGVNRGQFSTCLEDEKYDSVVTADAQEAAKAGARGTPYSLLVNEDGEVLQVISGAQPASAVEAAINSVLN